MNQKGKLATGLDLGVRSIPKKVEQIGVALTSLFIVLLYAASLRFNLPGGDSPELITTSFKGLPSHPPGYPLLSVLGKLASFVTPSAPLMGYQLLNLSISYAALGMVFVFMRRLGFGTIVGCASVLAVAVNEHIWQASVCFEVFALHNLLLILFFYFSLLWYQTSSPRAFGAASLVVGLGLSHHQFIIFPLFGLALPLLAKRRSQWFNLRSIGLACAGLLVGLSPYLYLLGLFQPDDIATWGNMTSLSDFFHFILRKDYGTLKVGASINGGFNFQPLFAYFGDFIWSQTWVIGAILGLVGAAVAFLKCQDLRFFVAATIVTFFLQLFAFHFLLGLNPMEPVQYEIASKMWNPLNLMWLVWVGPGLSLFINKRISVPGVAFLAWIVGQAVIHFPEIYHKNDKFHEILAQATTDDVQPSGWLLAVGDPFTHSTFFERYLNGERPDIKWIPYSRAMYPWFRMRSKAIYPELNFPVDDKSLLPFSLRSFIDANESRLPFFVSYLTDAEVLELQNRYHLSRSSFVTRIDRQDQVQRVDTSLSFVRTSNALANLELSSYHRLSWQATLLKIFLANAQHHLDDLIRDGRYSSAIEVGEALLKLGKSAPARMYNYLGYCYFKLANGTPALKLKASEAYQNYLKLGEPTPAERDEISRFLKQ